MFENAIRQRMAPFVDFPIIFGSALTKQRIFKVLETAKQVYVNRKAKWNNIQTQRGDAAIGGGLSATIDQGKIYQDQVLCTAAEHADTVVRILYQSAAVYQRAVSPFPWEQNTWKLVDAMVARSMFIRQK